MFPTTSIPLSAADRAPSAAGGASFSARLRRGIDLAVQFATLGEYGVAPDNATPAATRERAPRLDPPEAVPAARWARAPRSRPSPAAARSAARMAERGARIGAPASWAPARAATVVAPATRAARGGSRRVDERPRRVSTPAAVRSIALRQAPGAPARRPR